MPQKNYQASGYGHFCKNYAGPELAQEAGRAFYGEELFRRSERMWQVSRGLFGKYSFENLLLYISRS